MSEAESLKLIAEVVDKASPALKDIKERLKALTETSKEAHKAGAEHARAHNKAISEIKETLRSFTSGGAFEGISALTFRLGAAGAAAGATVLAIRKIVDTVYELGQRTDSLIGLSRQANISLIGRCSPLPKIAQAQRHSRSSN